MSKLKRKKKEKREQHTHDFTKSDYTFTPQDEGLKGWMASWSYDDVKVGDYVLLRNGHRSTRYEVTKFRRCLDPRDMWFADVKFAPRSVSAPLEKDQGTP